MKLFYFQLNLSKIRRSRESISRNNIRKDISVVQCRNFRLGYTISIILWYEPPTYHYKWDELVKSPMTEQTARLQQAPGKLELKSVKQNIPIWWKKIRTRGKLPLPRSLIRGMSFNWESLWNSAPATLRSAFGERALCTFFPSGNHRHHYEYIRFTFFSEYF